MFEVYDALDYVPGTTPARTLIVQKAVAVPGEPGREESAGDAGLQQELARAFVRVGDVQGNPTAANVGDASGALHSYGRAMVIAESLRGAAPDDLDALRTLALARRRRADVLALTGAKAEALVDLEKSSQLYLSAAAGPQASLDDKLEAGIAHVKLGDLLGNPNFENLGRADDARGEYAAGAGRVSAAAAGGTPTDWRMRRFLGLTLERVGTLHEDAGEWLAAQQSYEDSYRGAAGAGGRTGLASRHRSRPGHSAGEAGQRAPGAVGRGRGGAELSRGAGRLRAPGARRPQRRQRCAHGGHRPRKAGRRAVREAGNRAEAIAMLEAALATHRDLVAMDAGNVRASCDLARVAEAVGDLRAQSGAARGASLSCELWRESERARDSPQRPLRPARMSKPCRAKLRSCGS